MDEPKHYEDVDFVIFKTLINYKSDPYGLIYDVDCPNRSYEDIVDAVSKDFDIHRRVVIDRLKYMHLKRYIRITFYNNNGQLEKPITVTALEKGKSQYLERLEAETIKACSESVPQ